MWLNVSNLSIKQIITSDTVYQDLPTISFYYVENRGIGIQFPVHVRYRPPGCCPPQLTLNSGPRSRLDLACQWVLRYLLQSHSKSCHFTPFHVPKVRFPGRSLILDSGTISMELPHKVTCAVLDGTRPYLTGLPDLGFRGKSTSPLAGIFNFTNSAPLRRAGPRDCSRSRPSLPTLTL